MRKQNPGYGSAAKIGQLVSYTITRNQIPNLLGKISIPLGQLAGRTIFLSASIQASPNLISKVYAIDERIPQHGQSSPLGKPVAGIRQGVPSEFTLDGFYPNPFNPSMQFSYALPQDARVSLKLFDVLGREVATIVDEHLPAGYDSGLVDGKMLSSGVYFARFVAITVSGQIKLSQVNKLLLMK